MAYLLFPTAPFAWISFSPTLKPAFVTLPVDESLCLPSPQPSTLMYVSDVAFLSHSKTASGPNFSPSDPPNAAIKSAKLPIVMGTNAGPSSAVPITPAGIPTGNCFLGPERSISVVDTPGLL